MPESEQKVCTKCGDLKDLTLFPARQAAADKRASWCRLCYQADYDKRYGENHARLRESHNQSRNRLREQNAQKVFDYLTQNPCVACGESDPVVLEFDHRDRFDKVESISNLIRDAAWRRIEAEIKKCDVLCANCHRRKSARQFNYKRLFFLKQ